MRNTNRQVKVAKPAKRHDTDRSNINYGCTAANHQTNSIAVPIWQKAALTVVSGRYCCGASKDML